MPADQRMTDLEHLMWRLHADPMLTPTMGNLSILDSEPDFDRFRQRLRKAVEAVPRLRQRVVEVPGHFAPPVWRVDPHFDIDNHLQILNLRNGLNSMTHVEALAAELASKPFDVSRPPWIFTIITGVEGGKAAMVQQLHHSIADGEGTLKMSLAFMDFERHPAADAEGAVGTSGRRTGAQANQRVDVAASNAELPAERSDVQQWLADTTEAIGYTTQRGVDMFTKMISGAVERVRNPKDLPALGADVLNIVQSLGRQARSIDHRNSDLWTNRSAIRSFAGINLPFAPILEWTKTHGVTVNDVFVTAVVHACRNFHEQSGAELGHLNLSVPVSTRHGRAGANLFAPTVTDVTIASGGVHDQLRIVRDSMNEVKSSKSLSLVEPLAGTVNLLPIPLVLQAGRWVTSHVDVVCSNVRAAPFAAYIAGAKVETNFPLGPLSGSAVNVTMMSYDGNVNIGVHTDTEAVESAADLAALIEDAFSTLLSQP